MPEQHLSFFDAAAENRRNSFLLIAGIFVLFIMIVAAFSYLFGLGLGGIILGFILLAFYSAIVYFSGDKIILGLSGAKEVTREQYPFLYETVEGLALASQIPVPKIYVVNDPAPNAFATGRDPKHASLAATTGLINMMDHEQLEGVVAHEISHIANYDIRYSMVAIVFAGAIALIGSFAWRMAFWGGLSSGGDRRRGDGGIGIVIALIALVFVIAAPFFATLVRLALSRQRESLADANGARLTRYPEGLASALEKIKAASMPTKTANDATASLYFTNPFPFKMSLFATHPPIDERIKRLRQM